MEIRSYKAPKSKIIELFNEFEKFDKRRKPGELFYSPVGCLDETDMYLIKTGDNSYKTDYLIDIECCETFNEMKEDDLVICFGYGASESVEDEISNGFGASEFFEEWLVNDTFYDIVGKSCSKLHIYSYKPTTLYLMLESKYISYTDYYSGGYEVEFELEWIGYMDKNLKQTFFKDVDIK
jgi:hypothetical protein